MPLVVTDAWAAAMQRSDCQPVYLVTITHNDGSTFRALSGSVDALTDPVAVLSVGDVASEVDPINRESQVGECVVDFADAWIRPILVRKRLKGQALSIKVGAKGLAEADFVSYLAGVVDAIEPDGERDTGVVSFSVVNAFGILAANKIMGYWSGHPFQILYRGDGTGILEMGGLPVSLINTTRLDPSTVANATISHWALSCSGDAGDVSPSVGELTDAFTLAQEVALAAGGTLYIDGDGKVSFLQFDAAAASRADLTANDWISIKQEPLDENIINQVAISWSRGATNDVDEKLAVRDTDSQAAYAYPGTATRILSQDFETRWFGGNSKAGSLIGGITDVVTTMTVDCGSAFCGTVDKFPGPQPAWAELSASRWGYFQISNYAGRHEIVAARASTAIRQSGKTTTDRETGAQVAVGPYVSKMTLSSILRAQVGTTALAWLDGNRVCDITIQYALACARLSRGKYGCPVVEIELPFYYFFLEEGDLITITWTGFLAYGLDGVTSASKWEIVSKQATDGKTVTLRIAMAVNEALNVLAKRQAGPPTQIAKHASATSSANVSQAFVKSGFGVTF
jgi:hypothetical protein